MNKTSLGLTLGLVVSITACSSTQHASKMTVLDAAQVDQRTVSHMVLRDAEFRRLESRIDKIRSGELLLDPGHIELKDEYGVIPDRRNLPANKIREFDSELGLERTIVSSDGWSRWEVTYEFPDIETSSYFLFALARVGINNKRLSSDDPTHIHMGTFTTAKAAMERKAYLNYVLDLDWALIREIKISQ